MPCCLPLACSPYTQEWQLETIGSAPAREALKKHVQDCSSAFMKMTEKILKQRDAAIASEKQAEAAAAAKDKALADSLARAHKAGMPPSDSEPDAASAPPESDEDETQAQGPGAASARAESGTPPPRKRKQTELFTFGSEEGVSKKKGGKGRRRIAAGDSEEDNDDEEEDAGEEEQEADSMEVDEPARGTETEELEPAASKRLKRKKGAAAASRPAAPAALSSPLAQLRKDDAYFREHGSEIW
jgi:hypothetical protein